MNAYDSTMLFACAVCAGFDLHDGHIARGLFGFGACLVFAVIASVKQ